jgi:hypothetical protein
VPTQRGQFSLQYRIFFLSFKGAELGKNSFSVFRVLFENSLSLIRYFSLSYFSSSIGFSLAFLFEVILIYGKIGASTEKV